MERGKWIVLFGLFILVPFFGTSQSAEKVLFSVPGGFYEESPVLTLSTVYPEHHIRFTTNGNRPTVQSRCYTEPLLLDSCLYSTSDIYTIRITPRGEMFYPDSVRHCIVIRAAVFDENDSCVSEVATNSYFIQALGCDTHGLPVMSLCADSLDLFDFWRGILVPGAYYNPNIPDWTGNYFCKGILWERPCNVEFYERNAHYLNSGINQLAGVRTHGGASRRFQQKGLKIFAREDYGEKRFKHRFFDEIPLATFKHLTLKPFRCDNWGHVGVQDQLASRLAHDLGLESLASRQTVLFLNGEYWGIYALTEVPDERYLEDHFNADLEQINIMKKWTQLEHGDSTQWLELYRWMETADLTNPSSYDQAASYLDLDNFMDYQIFEIYSGNLDWPANNVRCWQEGQGKWRWFFYDGDGCFVEDWDVFANAIDTSDNINPSNARATLFFRKLIQQPLFMDRFKHRFQELMTHQWRYETLAPLFQSLCATLAGEVPFQAERFGFPIDFDQWESDVAAEDDRLFHWNEQMSIRFASFLSEHALPETTLVEAIRCVPNPSKGPFDFIVTTASEGVASMLLFDATGCQVFHQPVDLKPGVNHIPMNRSFAPGLYILKIGGSTLKIIQQ